MNSMKLSSGDNLHEIIGNLEYTLRELQTSLKEKETEVAVLEKEKESKDKIIQNIGQP